MKEILIKHGQEHLLRHLECLNDEEKSRFIKELEEINWEFIEESAVSDAGNGGEIAPIPHLSVAQIEHDRAKFESVGCEAIRAGKVAAVLLAGGQGTRLGSSAPKGTYDMGVTHPLYIFELHIKNLLAVYERCGAYVPLLIMTSDKNHEDTQRFFEDHGYFGYPAEYVRFFKQSMAPCVDFNGKLLLEGRGKLACSPNGNGGWYESLKKSNAEDGYTNIEWYNVFGVDNVLQQIADPAFVGATILSGKNCGAKGVKKTVPEEKVGLLCLKDGLPTVIEYYELSEQRANERNAEGDLLYSFGVTLNYLFHAKKLKEICEEELPVHLVKKKVPFLSEQGEFVSPEKENAYKFETLILDMVRCMGNCLPFEICREKEFAPVKNLTGVDSVDTARELLKKNGFLL